MAGQSARHLISIDETLSRAVDLPGAKVASVAFSLRSDTENRSIAICICAILWTAQRLELMAWKRADLSIFLRNLRADGIWAMPSARALLVASLLTEPPYGCLGPSGNDRYRKRAQRKKAAGERAR